MQKKTNRKFKKVHKTLKLCCDDGKCDKKLKRKTGKQSVEKKNYGKFCPFCTKA